MVVTEGGDGPVASHQQRQHVKALGAVVTHQLRASPGNVYNLGGDLRTVPWPAVYQGCTLCTQPTLMTQETRMGARGDHPTLAVLDMHDSVAVDAERPQACPLQLLAGHRLDRISPDLRDLHHHLRSRLTDEPSNGSRLSRAAFWRRLQAAG